MADESDPFEATRMTLGEHLAELRSRLIKGLLAVLVAFVAAWCFRGDLGRVIARPYMQAMGMLETALVAQAEQLLGAHPDWPRTRYFESDDPADKRLREFRKQMQAIGPGEMFLYPLKICLYFALFFGAPVLLWQMWQFVAAGLYPREKRAVRRYFPLSLVMFVGGVLFGYCFLVPYGIYFLNNEADLEVALPTITLEYYLSFLRTLCLALGVVFQLPLLMSFLGGAGLVQPATMAKYRGHFVIAAFVIAAVITPGADPISQLLVAVPLVVLYEIGIAGARLAARRRLAGLAPAGPPGAGSGERAP
ncbi:MAG: twin-arginine translocase subunit TatC [Planctomycetota bacterium]